MNKEIEELKTLKDLNIIFGKVHAPGGEVGVDELRAEAVKWVKFRRTTGVENVGFKDNVVGFIKEFFNLTEEDLE